MSDRKIITPEKFKRARPQDSIDINNPTMTVYGVACYVDGHNTGVSLYDSQAKQVFVLQTLKREEETKLSLWKQLDEKCKQDGVKGPVPLVKTEYKAINYPVY